MVWIFCWLSGMSLLRLRPLWGILCNLSEATFPSIAHACYTWSTNSMQSSLCFMGLYSETAVQVEPRPTWTMGEVINKPHTWIQIVLTWTNVGTSRVVAWVLWTPPLKLFSQVRGNRWLWWHQPPQKSLRHRRDHPPMASGAASDIQRSMAISLLKCGLTIPLLFSPDTSTAQLVWEFSKSLWSFHYKFCLSVCFYVLTHYHN